MRPRNPALPPAQLRKGPFFSSPTFVQPSVKPVPKQVEHYLYLSSRGVVGGHADTKIGADVLSPADRHLHLWHDVPIRLGVVPQIPGPDKLKHWRPQPAQPVIRRKTLPDRGIEKYRLRRNVRVTWQTRAELRLHKSIRAEKLVKSGKSFKRGRSGPKASRLVAGWQNSAAKQAQNRSRLQARKHDPLQAKCGVANTDIPGVILILKIDRDVNFNLIIHPEALLMNDVGRAPRSACRIHPRGDHNFIFRI